MPSTSELSFGAKLRNAQDMATFIKGFTNYAPPRPEESVANFKILVNSIVAANANKTTMLQNHNAVVKERQKTFRTGDISLFKLLSPIRGLIIAQYGKESTEFSQIDTIITKIRAGKLIIRLTTDGTTESTFSQSEQSYGSSTQFFNDLVTTLQTFPAYNPSKVNLKLPHLITFQNNLTTLNNAVATNFQKLNESRADRITLYEELTERANRIKAYVKANYGTQSQEYNLIKGLKI